MSPMRAVIRIFLLTGLVLAWVPASAQTRAEIVDRLDDLDKQMRALQRQVFAERGEVRAGSGAVVSGPVEGNKGLLLAELSVRIDGIERQIRQLTGMIEELQFAQRQMDDQFKLLREELTFRIERLEAGSALDADAVSPEAKGGLIATPDPDDSRALNDQLDAGELVVLPPDAEPSEAFRYAFAFVRKGDLTQGTTAMQTFIERFPDDPLAVNARFWLGKTLMQQGDAAEAGKQFLTIYEEHSEHEKAPESLIELGMALQALGDSEGACDALAVFSADYPDASNALSSKANNAAEAAGCENADG